MKAMIETEVIPVWYIEKWLKENDKEYEVNKAEKQVFINDIDGDFCYTIEIQECEGEI